ncbi:MAG: Imidazoleglycerol-phosphate dehydratase, partial [Candidatus Gottesmanbacteria bacterium GW2011_GWC2_39_8]
VTLESEIEVTINNDVRRECKVRTGIKFFNHMLMAVASRACLNVDISYKQTFSESLDHVVVEDVGLTFGRAVREMLDARLIDGVNQRGFYTVAFDEALVAVTLAFDGRAYSFLRNEVQGIKLEYVEDILSTNLRQFFEGFAQGAGCVVQIQFLAGEDPHHTWEAAFKAFGEALRDALSACPYRAGITIGLKGTGMEGKL